MAPTYHNIDRRQYIQLTATEHSLVINCPPLLLTSHTTSSHIGRYSFSVLLRVGGGVGLGGLLYTAN